MSTASDNTPEPAQPPTGPLERFPVIAVGGSAGALVGFQTLLANLPAQAPMAVVILSHQSAERPSLLGDILAGACAMPIKAVEEGETPVCGQVYVAPAGRHLGIHQGRFRLEAPVRRGHTPLPVDYFMRALAEDLGERAVGVVLSGMGSDGTLGLAAIQHAAGLTLAQSPEEAEFGSMPASAIAAGVVDFVLSAQDMARRLLALVEHHLSVPRQTSENGLQRAMELVAAHTGQDFSSYKRGTLERRIQRRLHLHGYSTVADYVAGLADDPDELEALRRDWLIGVSSFFRDPEAFDALEGALQAKLRDWPAERELRIWVPGCATGEEAYSVAILLLDLIERLGKPVELRVFATDLDELAIDRARLGRFPQGVVSDLSNDRLQRYFVADDHHRVVRKHVRERVVFATQNVLSDPPFTRIDLISCRNLLIYLQRPAQLRVLKLFHYSLNAEGLLFLGRSETLWGADELYTVVDRDMKLFRRKLVERPAITPVDWNIIARDATPGPIPRETSRVESPDLAELMRRELVDRYAPPALIIDDRGDIEHIHGRTGDFLEPAPGQPSMNLLDMARSGLRAPLASALQEIVRGSSRSVIRDAQVHMHGAQRRVHVRIRRLRAGAGEPSGSPRTLFLVTFETPHRRTQHDQNDLLVTRESTVDERVMQLEGQLRAMREDHQSVVEALQASNEELASANEEVQSVNEELQSTNEELQSAKEETQSLNEELQTVNAELESKVANLVQANDDLRNLMDSAGVGMVFTDERLRIKRFTPEARNVVPLIASDVGRPLSDITTSLEYPGLLTDAESVLRSLTPRENEVGTRSGSWYSVQIRPYRTSLNTIDGVSISFVDISRAKRAEQVAQTALQVEIEILDAMQQPFLVLDRAFDVVRANRAFCSCFGLDPKPQGTQSLFSVAGGRWNDVALRQWLAELPDAAQVRQRFSLRYRFDGSGERLLRLQATRIGGTSADGTGLVLLSIEDPTDPQPGD
ncbi:MAG: PAS domain-containing protein [Gammaproteobacteria bacterium]|nr:PAS domain-containing protein [Gammaproteobacteria bacterium]